MKIVNSSSDKSDILCSEKLKLSEKFTKPQIKESLSIVVVNSRSIKNKVADFYHVILNGDAVVIIGTERWLSDEIHDREIFPKSYSIWREDRKTRTGGGLFVAVKEEITSGAENFGDGELESFWCSIECSAKKYFICEFNRPPD